MRSGRGVAIAAGQNGADVMCTDGEGTLAMLALAVLLGCAVMVCVPSTITPLS